MKHLRWLPFAFLAGQHGFAIFAPYAALMLMLGDRVWRAPAWLERLLPELEHSAFASDLRDVRVPPSTS